MELIENLLTSPHLTSPHLTSPHLNRNRNGPLGATPGNAPPPTDFLVIGLLLMNI